MIPQSDSDPTADAVLRRERGSVLDSLLKVLHPFELAMLTESASGLSYKQISHKHRVPEMVVMNANLYARELIRPLLEELDIDTDMTSRLLFNLELAATPRCGRCGAVLRDAEQQRPGRRIRFCGNACRAAAHRDRKPSTQWQSGYLGTCGQNRCAPRCRKTTGWTFDDMILAPDRASESDLAYRVVVHGLTVGWLRLRLQGHNAYPAFSRRAIPLSENTLLATAHKQLPSDTATKLFAARLCAGYLSASRGIRGLTLLVERPMQNAAYRYGFRSPSGPLRIHPSGSRTMTWDLDAMDQPRADLPVVHVVA